MTTRKDSKIPWQNTPEGDAAYRAAREDAQKKANSDGFDRGLERNPFVRSYSVFMLPRRENRCGHERSCEVVSCEDLSRCQPGHGPKQILTCNCDVPDRIECDMHGSRE